MSGSVPTDGTRAVAPVMAYAPPGPTRTAVLTWATGLAEAERADLHVLVPSGRPAGPVLHRAPPRLVERTVRGLTGPLWGPVLTRALYRGLGALADDVRVWAAMLIGEVSTPKGRVGRALLEQASQASALVVPADIPDGGVLAAEASCPVAFVPASPPPAGGPVVVGVLGATGDPVDDRLGDAVLAAAFAAAARRRSALVAVHVEPVVGTPGESADELRRRADDLVAARAMVCARVPVEVRPVRGDPVGPLEAAAKRAGLVVLGRSRRVTRLGAAASPVRALLPATHCPVLVVPAPEPPRRQRRPVLVAGPEEDL